MDGVGDFAQENADQGVVDGELQGVVELANENVGDDTDEDTDDEAAEPVVPDQHANRNNRGASNPRPVIKIGPFSHFVRDLTEKYGATGMRMQANALDALHTAAEDYIVNVMREARIHSESAGHDFLTSQDLAMGVRVVGLGEK